MTCKTGGTGSNPWHPPDRAQPGAVAFAPLLCPNGRQVDGVSRVFQFALCALLFGLCRFSSHAALTSLYVFGDGVSTTTNGPGGAYYHGNRYCNGRVWVEVLAQRQGLAYDPDQNWSFFGHYSPNLVTNVGKFVPSVDVSTALFIIWVGNADFVYNVSHYAPYTTNNLAVWTNAINQSLSNHFTAIQTLYAKGARTLVMPNAVDLTKVPFYVGLSAANKSFIRQRVIEFNLGFATRLNQARAAFTNLTILSPDIFTLFENFLARPGDYGLTNVLSGGQSIDALSDPALANKSLNGPGANYIFWDYLDPSAKAQAVMADVIQQLVAPTRIAGLAPLAAGNRLDFANLPLGLGGFVEESTNFVNWAPAQTIPGTNAPQTIVLPTTGPLQFYRLRFPHAWSWP